jgi:hypothetical protein
MSDDGRYECRLGRRNGRKDSERLERDIVDIVIELVNDIESSSIDHRLSFTTDELPKTLEGSSVVSLLWDDDLVVR